ncbi:uncharacterized protein LOC136027736 [Artemia franciscana]|uniref:uncharacterized protein LOC136027736 n=1 Tax=Artemia franciscana TaxID=6661 RepID=UPI0032D9FF4F
MSRKLYLKRRSIGANINVTPPMKTMRNLNKPGIKLGIARESIRQNMKRNMNYASARNLGRHSVTELLVNGNIVSTPNDIAAELSRQFKSAFTPPDDAHLPEAPEYSIEEPMQKITVVAFGVKRRLKLLNPNKSVGPDEVHPRVLKEAHTEIALPLTSMFQKSVDTKQIPQDWRNANATPVHKGGSRNSISNYRLISLTSVAGKILEGIVNTRIVENLTTNELLNDSQHGF